MIDLENAIASDKFNESKMSPGRVMRSRFLVEPGERGKNWMLTEYNERGQWSGARRYFPTQAEANTARDEKLALPPCGECGDPVDASYMEPTKTEMLNRQMCFNCNFWTNRLRQFHPPDKHFIANGRHYTIEPDEPKGNRKWSGFGGSQFRIRFFDGREVVSHNVWHQGEVPEHFRDRLPDNAEIVR